MTLTRNIDIGILRQLSLY